MSISPQSHHVRADASSFPNNCNASLLRKGCACAATCCMVCHSQGRRLFRSCGVSDGPADSANNYSASLPREGCARVATCYTVPHSRSRRLLRSCGVPDGPANSANNCNPLLPNKAMHVLLFVVRFAVLNADDYFALVAFQMARLILYVAWHAVLSAGNCDVHMQILTCLD